MKVPTLKFLILLIISVLYACDEEELALKENDYLIFGYYYGHCVGEECVETFKLTKYKLYEDKNDSYAGTNAFDFVELSDEKFQSVKSILENFPTKLLDENPKTFGCPDCADQGGVLIIYSKNGVEKKWLVDQSKNDVPNHLHNFIDTVNNAVSLINN